MTSSPAPQEYPVAAALAAAFDNDEEDTADPTVGRSDADADAVRSGAKADLRGATRDSDGIPVGRADADEDRRASGA